MATKQEILDAIAGATDEEDIVFVTQDDTMGELDVFDSGPKNGKYYIYLELKQ